MDLLVHPPPQKKGVGNEEFWGGKIHFCFPSSWLFPPQEEAGMAPASSSHTFLFLLAPALCLPAGGVSRGEREGEDRDPNPEGIPAPVLIPGENFSSGVLWGSLAFVPSPTTSAGIGSGSQKSPSWWGEGRREILLFQQEFWGEMRTKRDLRRRERRREEQSPVPGRGNPVPGIGSLAPGLDLEWCRDPSGRLPGGRGKFPVLLSQFSPIPGSYLPLAASCRSPGRSRKVPWDAERLPAVPLHFPGMGFGLSWPWRGAGKHPQIPLDYPQIPSGQP